MGYRGKVAEQERARDLRAEGWTYAEICEELGVARSSVSLWVRDVTVDPTLLEGRRRNRNFGARNRAPNKLQRAKQAEIERCREEGVAWLGDLSERDLLVAGIALYAGEGTKRDGNVKFTNSDPQMMGLFLRFFRHFFEVDERRLRLRLYLHQGLDLDAANRYWSELTGISTDQFHAPYRAVADPSIRRVKHPKGCATVSYACSRTHRRLSGLIRALLSSTLPSPG